MTHEWSETKARIGVEGLPRTVRVLHVTDQHIALIDARDAAFVEACQKTRAGFAQYRHDLSGAPVPTERTFVEILAPGQNPHV